MNRNSWIALVGCAIAILAVAYFGTPFLALHSLREAARSGDQDKLDELVDFPAVRQNLKEEISAYLLKSMRHDPSLANNPFAGLGLLLAPAMVDSAIDHYVTPSAMAAMVNNGKVQAQDGEGGSVQSADQSQSKVHVQYAYVSLDRFKATVTSDESPGNPLGFVFERRNVFGWKLIRIDLPLGSTQRDSTETENAPSDSTANAGPTPDVTAGSEGQVPESEPAAQETAWSALSHTATAITGDIALGPGYVRMAGVKFPLRLAAEVPSFASDDGEHPAEVFAVNRTMDPILLNGNRLCGDPVSWIAIWQSSANELGMAAFTSGSQPTSENADNLCATFSYVR